MPVFIKNIMAVFGAHSALIARNKKLPANEKISFGFRQPAQKFVQSRQSPRGALRGRRRQKNARAAPAGQTAAGPHLIAFSPNLTEKGKFCRFAARMRVPKPSNRPPAPAGTRAFSAGASPPKALPSAPSIGSAPGEAQLRHRKKFSS